MRVDLRARSLDSMPLGYADIDRAAVEYVVVAVLDVVRGVHVVDDAHVAPGTTFKRGRGVFMARGSGS